MGDTDSGAPARRPRARPRDYQRRRLEVRGYVKASIQHEFDEKTDIWLDRRLFVSDLSGTWGNYGLGLQYRAKHGQSLFFDFEYGCGEKREQPWAVQLGYRIEM